MFLTIDIAYCDRKTDRRVSANHAVSMRRMEYDLKVCTQKVNGLKKSARITHTNSRIETSVPLMSHLTSNHVVY